MRNTTPLTVSVAAGVALLLAAPAPSFASPARQADPTAQTVRQPLERQVLPANDGWAAAGTGTTGGAGATPDRVYDVSNRGELLAAFASGGSEPKIIRVHGDIQANVGAAGAPLSCEDYASGTGYSLAHYLHDFDPARFGTTREPEGPQESARRLAAAKQASTIRWDIPSNTTIVGAGPDSSITGAALRINRAQNVILRNLTVRDAADCFPSWDPTDGATGNWNSEYDLLQIINGSTNVWVAHSQFTDAPNLDSAQPSYFGRPYQVHDGAVDVTNGSDLVTMSYNRFSEHDKLLLIGSTDSTSRGDVGNLRVTIHHNVFENVGQRAPRVRYGQVDVYNNHFKAAADSKVPYGYTFGAGVESHLHAEANAFTIPAEVPVSSLIAYFKGKVITTTGNAVNGKITDLRAEYNAAAPADRQLAPDNTWTPALRTHVNAAQAVPALLADAVGPVFTSGEAR
ncbi:polysaccharide lyase family 1 protein [Pseudarthrobacter sp. NamB4]|uniref:pectate lyase family protein n=1 Tax=Pseudarthrobacter sp. NamB4 TaxID=2576837 RepID=UPI0010FEE285|nr:polysaccharide lyase family 1 protein [Pseudarthrobacter sp. NamB4]TLM73818.1 polysaccharide lyase family 1 protein [Pseudarthrobacter sp. NamB4]